MQRKGEITERGRGTRGSPEVQMLGVNTVAFFMPS